MRVAEQFGVSEIVGRKTPLYYKRKNGKLNVLRKNDFIDAVKTNPSILFKLLGRERLLKEIKQIDPTFIESAGVRVFGIMPMLQPPDRKGRSLKKRLLYSGQQFTMKSIKGRQLKHIYIKPHAPTGTFTHELMHAHEKESQRLNERAAEIAGAIARNALDKPPFEQKIMKMLGYTIFSKAAKAPIGELQEYRRRILVPAARKGALWKRALWNE